MSLKSEWHEGGGANRSRFGRALAGADIWRKENTTVASCVKAEEQPCDGSEERDDESEKQARVRAVSVACECRAGDGRTPGGTVGARVGKMITPPALSGQVGNHGTISGDNSMLFKAFEMQEVSSNVPTSLRNIGGATLFPNGDQTRKVPNMTETPRLRGGSPVVFFFSAPPLSEPRLTSPASGQLQISPKHADLRARGTAKSNDRQVLGGEQETRVGGDVKSGGHLQGHGTKGIGKGR